MLTIREAREITERFYSCFCCMDLSGHEEGVRLVCSPDREQMLAGLGCRYTLFILRRGESCLAAYAPRHREFMETLRGLGPEELIQAAREHFVLKERRLMILSREPQAEPGRARILGQDDYPLYEEFFRQVHPGADYSGWLREYFEEKAGERDGMFTGCQVGGRLVSVCDPPDMPYMGGRIQHTGINTLDGFRRQGYARSAAALAARNLLDRGICPQWDCRADNEASRRTAMAVGYEEYGSAHILEEG